MNSLSLYPISSSLHTMNNLHHHHHHHHYGTDGTNTNFSGTTHQLSENSVNVTSESSSSSCLVQSPAVDYYSQHSYHHPPPRAIPLYSHQTHPLYQDNTNNLYRYNVLPSSNIVLR